MIRAVLLLAVWATIQQLRRGSSGSAPMRLQTEAVRQLTTAAPPAGSATRLRGRTIQGEVIRPQFSHEPSRSNQLVCVAAGRRSGRRRKKRAHCGLITRSTYLAATARSVPSRWRQRRVYARMWWPIWKETAFRKSSSEGGMRFMPTSGKTSKLNLKPGWPADTTTPANPLRCGDWPPRISTATVH